MQTQTINPKQFYEEVSRRMYFPSRIQRLSNSEVYFPSREKDLLTKKEKDKKKIVDLLLLYQR